MQGANSCRDHQNAKESQNDQINMEATNSPDLGDKGTPQEASCSSCKMEPVKIHQTFFERACRLLHFPLSFRSYL